jgi:putative SOS response-associated peptidase YedK
VCNRYNLKTSKPQLETLFGHLEDDFAPVDDQWPMRPGLVYRPREDRPQREGVMMRWGLVPFWADDPKIGRTMTNARCETVATKPGFRAAFKARRCLVPVTAFCEPHNKKWYRFTLTDLPLFAFAGLWERWDKGDEPLETYTFLTTEANELVAEYHARQRQPVILTPDDFDTWLTGTREDVEALYRPYPADRMAVAEIPPAAEK